MKTLSRDRLNRPPKNLVLGGLLVSHSKGDLYGIEIEKVDIRDRYTP
jgi:hypothetical protein